MKRGTSNVVNSIDRRPKAMLALGGIVLALCISLLLSSAPGAQAGTSSYCSNQTLGSHARCGGAGRTLYALYGWGDQHSVCVGVYELPGHYTCSGGAGQGTYNDLGTTAWFTPWIQNNAEGNNTVHGVAYQP